jgi:hypothetical protein
MKRPTALHAWLALGALVACGAAGQRLSHRQAAPAQPVSGGSAETTFSGMCDASGAVALSAQSMLVADDEDNVLRVYDVERGGPPSAELDLSPVLRLPAKQRKDGSSARAPETDIEAATLLGDRAYFVTSHGRNRSGKLKPERLRFFATRAPQGGQLRLVGEVYEGLLNDLLDEPRLGPFELKAASELPPKAPGGLNIEGMTARVEGGVWLGFRNPIPRGRALLVPLLNPEGLVAAERARFGDPLTLDLSGLGVRGLSYWRGQYLIAAGPFDAERASTLFAWDGHGSVQNLKVPKLERYNPEAFFTWDERSQILVLSDDGASQIEGVECKRLKDRALKRFRGLWVMPSRG